LKGKCPNCRKPANFVQDIYFEAKEFTPDPKNVSKLSDSDVKEILDMYQSKINMLEIDKQNLHKATAKLEKMENDIIKSNKELASMKIKSAFRKNRLAEMTRFKHQAYNL
jgi:hypothetical protein